MKDMKYPIFTIFGQSTRLRQKGDAREKLRFKNTSINQRWILNTPALPDGRPGSLTTPEAYFDGRNRIISRSQQGKDHALKTKEELQPEGSSSQEKIDPLP
jgi:hypothetical protein